MSLLNAKELKTKKTADFQLYQKEYRENNREHLRAIERNKYYKNKYHLDDNFLSLFGKYSGDVFKIITSFDKLVRLCPELKDHILTELSNENSIYFNHN